MMDLWMAGWICVGTGLLGVLISIMGILTSRAQIQKKERRLFKADRK